MAAAVARAGGSDVSRTAGERHDLLPARPLRPNPFRGHTRAPGHRSGELRRAEFEPPTRPGRTGAWPQPSPLEHLLAFSFGLHRGETT